MKNESQLDDFKNMLESACIKYSILDPDPLFRKSSFVVARLCEFEFDESGNLVDFWSLEG